MYYDCKSKREREKQRKLRWKLAVDSLRQVPNCIDIICCKNINVNKSFYQCRTKSMYVLNGVIAWIFNQWTLLEPCSHGLYFATKPYNFDSTDYLFMFCVYTVVRLFSFRKCCLSSSNCTPLSQMCFSCSQVVEQVCKIENLLPHQLVTSVVILVQKIIRS